MSKTTSHKRWRSKPENRDYFRGPVHVLRVRAWRTAHPGYARGGRSGPPLQDECVTQAIELTGESGVRPFPAAVPLQDLLAASAPVLAGLIAHLFQLTLQDEMAATTRRLVQLGTDLISGGGGGEGQTSAVPAAAATGAEPVQLG
ncbi:MAG: hypothetical protein WCA12_19975 [Burkholderiales bacterium]